MLRARDSLTQATKLLLPASTTTTSTLGDSSRHHGIATVHAARTELLKGRNRSQTVQRPKTAFFNDDDSVLGGSSATLVGDHVITAPVPPGKLPKVKAEKKKVRLDRSSTFRNKDKERDKSAGGEGEGSFKVPEQQYIKCVISLKDSLQEMMVRPVCVCVLVSRSSAHAQTLPSRLDTCTASYNEPRPSYTSTTSTCKISKRCPEL